MFVIQIKCYNLLVPAPPINIVDDENLRFFLEGSDASRMLLFVSMTSNGSHGVDIENPNIPTTPTHNIPTMSTLEENIELCNLGMIEMKIG